MPTRKKARAHEHSHNDGSLWARGALTGGVMTGYWEWFRKDGSRMRSGSFKRGEQVGEWTTYDRQGRIVKVTRMGSKGRTPVGRKSTRARAEK